VNLDVSVVIGWLVAETILSTAVFMAIAAISHLLRGSGPRLHHALWALVLVRLILPPTLTHPLALGQLTAHGVALARNAMLTAQSVPVGSPQELDLPHDGSTAAGAVAPKTTTVWQQMLFCAWLIGIGLLSAARFHRHRRFRRLMTIAREVRTPIVLGLLARWRHRHGIRRRVRVLSTTGRFSPFAAGVFRPMVVLPDAVLRDQRLLEAALAHELAHVARWDSLWLGLQRLVETVYFFHPIVWISGHRIDHERERDCDARVLELGTIPRSVYARSLLDVMIMGLEPVHAPALSQKRRLAGRIESVLAGRGSHHGILHATLVALVALFVLPLAAVSDPRSADRVPTPAAEPAVTSIPTPLADPLPDGRLTWGWGPGRDPFAGHQVHHRGIDLAAPAGTVIRSPADGMVRVATEKWEPSPGSGAVLVLDHGDGLSSFFAHLQSVDVEPGQKVARGAAVAKVGSSGRSTGPHLHFEVWQDGEPVDPMDRIERRLERPPQPVAD